MEAQASRESKISGSPPQSSNPSIHEPTAQLYSLPLSNILFSTMSTPGTLLARARPKPLRLIFRPLDQDALMRDKLANYAVQVDAFWVGIRFMLTFLQVDEAMWPPGPATKIPPSLMQDYAIWRRASEISEATAHIKSFLKDVQIHTTQQEKEQLRQNLVGATPGPSNTIKTLMPLKYNGKKGDPAFTFIAACNNYQVMKPGAFLTDAMCVRWVLQQMEEKVGPWSIRQMS